MDIKKCKIFAITAETNKISRTAELTGYTQSGVSQILKSLEKEVGMPLLKRDQHGVHLTPIGRDFLRHVKTFLAANENIEQYIYDIHGMEVGTITIGAYQSIASSWLPDVLENFCTFHPGIDIVIKEGGLTEIEQWLTDMDIDLGIYSRQTTKNSFEFTHLAEDPLMAVVPPDYTFKGEVFPLSEFKGKRFIMSEEGVDLDIHRYLKKTKFNPEAYISCKDDYTIISLVERGLGFSILPGLTLKSRPGSYSSYPLDPGYSRDLGIFTNDLEYSAPLVQSFILAFKDRFSGNGDFE